MSVKSIQGVEFESHRDMKIHFCLQVQPFGLSSAHGFWSFKVDICIVKKAIDSYLYQNRVNIKLILVLQLRLEFGRISQWKALILCLCFVSSAHFCCSCLNPEVNCVTQETILGYGVCVKYYAKYGKNTVPLSSMPCISFIDNLHVY